MQFKIKYDYFYWPNVYNYDNIIDTVKYGYLLSIIFIDNVTSISINKLILPASRIISL